MRRNGPRKSHPPDPNIKSTNKGPAHLLFKHKSSPLLHKPQSAAQRSILEHLKKRGKSGFQASFSLPLGTVLKALKRKHFQSKDQVSKATIIMTRVGFLH
jgi:hypothetical protein